MSKDLGASLRDRATRASHEAPAGLRHSAGTPSADDAPIPCRASIYPRPRSAINVLADELECDLDRAREVLESLIKGGYFIAPRVPTDHMLSAYFNAYGTQAWTPKTIIQNIGKARLRWQSMGQAGIAVALSWKSVERTAQGIAAHSDETPSAAQPEGQEPDPKDAPNTDSNPTHSTNPDTKGEGR